MKTCWKVVCPILLLWLLLAGGCCSDTSTITQDVIPARWIGYDGMRPAPSTESDEAYVFPSTTEPAATDVSFPAPQFLPERSSLTKAADYVLGSWVVDGKPEQLLITLKPDSPKSRDVHFIAHAKVVEAIRRVDWDGFQQEQARFEWWVSEHTAPPLREQIFGGAHGIYNKKELRDFWLKCLEGAEVGKQLSVRKWAPDPTRSTDDNFGPKMGAVPLRPGMRLVIHWGGTTFYQFGSQPTYVMRQTTAGTTTVDVTHRGASVVLAIPRFLKPISSDGKPSSWTIGSRSPPPTSAAPNTGYWPFGKDNGLGGHLVPVFNEMDLWHVDALRKKQSKENALLDDSAPYLTLLIPIEYIKSDLARREGQYTDDFSAGSHDAFTVAGDNILQSLARRYVLWGSSVPFTSPENAPALDLTDPVKAVSDWDYAPLVFGNQTSVSVELPVSCNAEGIFYVPLGYTCGDVLDLHGPWVLNGDGCNPMVRRSEIRLPPPGDHSAAQVCTRILRLHRLSPAQLHRIEIAPGDHISFSGPIP